MVSLRRCSAFASLAAIGLLALAAPSSAGAALPITLPLLDPPAAITKVVAPVAAPLSADPEGAVRGTMIMIHGGGWAGHDAHVQGLLMQTPGALLRARGWRTVSIDYDEGTNGLQDVLDAAGAELTRGSGDGPLCVYGESSGGHLALVAAARLRAIDCVVTLGAPTDVLRYESEGPAVPDGRVKLVAARMGQFFGTTAAAVAPWSPLALAPSIHADVLLMREGDDAMIPESHVTEFKRARPSSQTVDLEAGDPADAATHFVHGTISASGRDAYAAAIAAITERAVRARLVTRSAAHMRCPRVSRSIEEVGLRGVREALGCLARRDARIRTTATGHWHPTTLTMRGTIDAARIWASLRATGGGRRVLAAVATRRAVVDLRTTDASRITLRRAR